MRKAFISKKWGISMDTMHDRKIDHLQENDDILRMLDRGIDDMEAGRELPYDKAFREIEELRESRRNARL